MGTASSALLSAAAIGGLLVLAPMSAHAQWWRGAVIYHIYPRSFFDSNGDG